MTLYDVLQPVNEDGFCTTPSLCTLSLLRHSLVRIQPTEVTDLVIYCI